MRALILTTTLSMGGTMAPAPDDSSAEQARDRERGLELIALGDVKFELADYEGAIEVWGQAYLLLPLSMRGQLRIPLASAHVRAYEGNGEREHLRRAREQYAAHLDTLDVSDEDLRVEIQAELAKIDAKLAELDAAAAHQDAERAERDRALAERQVEAIQVVEVPESLQLDFVDASSSARARQFRVRVGVGGALAGLGLVSLGTMTAALALGERADKDGAAALEDGAPHGELLDINAQGQRYNAMAWASGAIGSALLGSSCCPSPHASWPPGRRPERSEGAPGSLRINPR